MTVTLRQIAQQCGVSIATVSHALAGNSKRPSRATAERILKVAAELGYDPSANNDARTLVHRRTGRQRAATGTVGIVVWFGISGDLASDPYHGIMRRGIDDVLSGAGLESFYVYSDSTVPAIIRRDTVDGVIVMRPVEGFSDSITRLGLPCVSLVTGYDEEVGPDNRGGIRAATEHLFSLGHKSLGYIGYTPVTMASIERRQGFIDAHLHAGIPLDLNHVHSHYFSYEHAAQNADRIIDQSENVTGFVCHNDGFAMTWIHELQKRGHCVPGDFSVIGFDNIGKEMMFRPTLASVDYGLQEAGRIAARRLLAKIAGEEAGSPVVLTARVAPGESAAAPTYREAVLAGSL